MVLDAGLTIGSRGGHGPIGYQVEAYEPGRRIRFRFTPGLGLAGYHELLLTSETSERCWLTHTLVARTSRRMILLWPLVIRPLHEALLQDLLDTAERQATGRLNRPAPPWSRRVRRLRATQSARPRPTRLPEGATLATAELPRVDVLDAWQIPNTAGLTPGEWAAAFFREDPGWVGWLLRLRNALARWIGLDRAEPESTFAALATSDKEVLLGGANRDFVLRISVFATPEQVVCTTLTRALNRRGRVYLTLIRRLHPPIVRAVMRRAMRSSTSEGGVHDHEGHGVRGGSGAGW